MDTNNTQAVISSIQQLVLASVALMSPLEVYHFRNKLLQIALNVGNKPPLPPANASTNIQHNERS